MNWSSILKQDKKVNPVFGSQRYEPGQSQDESEYWPVSFPPTRWISLLPRRSSLESKQNNCNWQSQIHCLLYINGREWCKSIQKIMSLRGKHVYSQKSLTARQRNIVIVKVDVVCKVSGSKQEYISISKSSLKFFQNFLFSLQNISLTIHKVISDVWNLEPHEVLLSVWFLNGCYQEVR